jgi:predicted DNA-binding transcriptional regulator AlpA
MADTPAVRLAHVPDSASAGPVEEPPSTDPKAHAAAVLSAAVEALLLPAEQAAALCAVSPATWYRMAAAGRCPAAIRLSRGCVRWRADELREWIAAGCPSRREWEARRAADNASGRPRQAGR